MSNRKQNTKIHKPSADDHKSDDHHDAVINVKTQPQPATKLKDITVPKQKLSPPTKPVAKLQVVEPTAPRQETVVPIPPATVPLTKPVTAPIKTTKTSEQVELEPEPEPTKQRNFIRISQYTAFPAFTRDLQLPRLFNSLLDHQNLLQLNGDVNSINMAHHLGGRQLYREKSGKFMWHTPDLNNLQSIHYHISCGDRCGLSKMSDAEVRQYYTERICPDILQVKPSRFLHKYSPTKSEALLRTLQCDYFKLLRIVCDSYATFNRYYNKKCGDCCDLVLPMDRPFCGIKPIYNKKLSSSAANRIARLPSWVLSPDIAMESLYDQDCLDATCQRTHYPTPYHITMSHDYRSPRCNWSDLRVIDLAYMLSGMVKNNFLRKNCGFDSKSPFVLNRLRLRDQCTLHCNDMCNKADNYIAHKFEKKVDDDLEHNIQKRLEWCLRTEKFLDSRKNDLYKISTPTYYALQSLPPISIWFLRTAIAQAKARANPCKHTCKYIQCDTERGMCDIRCDVERFAKDVQSCAKRFSVSTSAANRRFCDAFNHHRNVVKRTLRLDNCNWLVAQTNARWAGFFLHPMFKQRLARSRSQLRTTHPLWIELQNIMERSRIRSNLRPLFFKLQRLCGNNFNSKRSKSLTVKKDVAKEPYKLDSKQRKVSNLITPSILNSTKSKLRPVFKRPVWFEYLAQNPLVGNALRSQNFLDSVFSFFQRRLSQ